MTDILAPFEKNQQILLTLVDSACQAQSEILNEDITRRRLSGESFSTLDDETFGWINIIKAYGILYNRAVEAGWIENEIIITNEG